MFKGRQSLRLSKHAIVKLYNNYRHTGLGLPCKGDRVSDEEVDCDTVKSTFGELLLSGVLSGRSAVTNRLLLSVAADFISTGPSVVFVSSVEPSAVKLGIFVDKNGASESDFSTVTVTGATECGTSSLSDVTKTPPVTVEYDVSLPSARLADKLDVTAADIAVNETAVGDGVSSVTELRVRPVFSVDSRSVDIIALVVNTLVVNVCVLLFLRILSSLVVVLSAKPADNVDKGPVSNNESSEVLPASV